MINKLLHSDSIEFVTLRRVIAGVWMICALVIIVGVWFVSNKPAYILGELIGSLIATLLMLHLYHCIDVELDLAEAKAQAHSKINSVLRITIEIAVVVGCFFINKYINPFTLLAGLFGRKLGAVLVPIVFDRERTGKMLEEDEKEMIKYGRLLTKKEREDMDTAE